MASRRLSENHPVTPDNSTTLSGSSRSRKCLDMALKSNKKVASPLRGSPLSDRNNLPHPTLITPTKHAPNQPPSPTSSSKFILSSSDLSRSPSPEIASLSTPLFIPKTPQPELRRPRLSKVSVPSPAVKRAPMAVSTKKKASSPPPDSTTTSSAPIPTIVTTSFYSTKSSTTTPQPSAPPSRLALSQPPRRRSNSGGSLRRHRSRSSGGASKRKRGHSGGVGHNIKKPKLRHKAESSKPMKISSLPALSVELPSCKSSPRPSTSKASLTPTSGQLNLSKQTKVQFEVKGGQFVYRTQAKTATTPKTPLRRSPRKNFSPLKADYFSSSVKERGKGKGGKLFSPNANFLNPELLSPDKRVIPSPVKFDSSVESRDDSHNLSELITSLAKDQAGELAISVMSGVTAVIDPSTTTPQFSSLSGNIPDISLAVSNILNDLSSGDDSLTDTGGDTSASSVDQQADTPQPPSKLFPIFCKSTAKTGDDGGTITSLQSHGKRFLCSSLSDSQTIIDAGQKEIGPTLCLTCGTVYTVGDPEDEGHHEQLHSGLLDKLKLPVWKTERVVGQFPAGRVLCVRPGDHGSHWKKVEEALSVVDRDLGFSEVGIRWPEKTKVFLFVADKKIVGFLLAESIEEGFKILPNKDCEVTGKVYCCSETSHPVKCGISRVWVLADYRRNKVASSLVDCMRSSFFQNHYLKDNEFAFSDPTLNGIEFATSYMRSQEFLVYNR